MASKPLPESTPKISKPSAARRTPLAAGKENPSASRPNPFTKLSDKPTASVVPAVRWSTSSLPRGKPALNASASDQRAPRVSSIGRDLDAEIGGRKSLGGGKTGKGLVRLNSRGLNEKSVARVQGLDGQKKRSNECFGLQLAKKESSASKLMLMNKGAKNAKLFVEDSAAVMIGSRNKSEVEVGVKPIAISNTLEGVREVSKDSTFLVSESGSVNKNTLGGLESLVDGSQQQVSVTDLTLKVVSDAAVNCEKEDVVCGSSVPETIMKSDTKTGKFCSKEVCAASEDQEPAIDEQPIPTFTVFEKEIEPAKGVQGNTKYKNKLQEKLALLEEKVQKIASEIKLTKEMLDSNNPNESKLILSDIQSKISGIEMAVEQVVGGSKDKVNFSESKAADCSQTRSTVSGQPGEAVSSKHHVIGLNHEELEARFFPHHKLIRNRSLQLSTNEEDPIALEFLASLDVEKPEPAKQTIPLKSETSKIYNVGADNSSVVEGISRKAIGYFKDEVELLAKEKIDDFDDQENKPAMFMSEETEESTKNQLNEIGSEPSTAGWFVSEGEAVLLAHDDGSCSYYDVANYEIKSKYKPPAGMPSNTWGDCWLIRASGADGCSGRYVVAASAGNSLESGFCSWDFYTKEVTAFCIEGETANSSMALSSSSSRTVLGTLNNTGVNRRTVSTIIPTTEQPQWWFRPSGSLLLSTGSRQKLVSAYDIRDGDLVMKWEVNSPVLSMEYSSPLQWRSRGKVVIAGRDAISLWDVNSLNPQPLLSVVSGKRVQSLHINDTDAELGGGVRQRVSQSEVEGNDGVFCTQESINVLDFRLPSGVGLKISSHGISGHSIFSRGDSLFIGTTDGRLPIKSGPRSRIQHYSQRKGKLCTSFELPEFNTHFNHSSITQVWGNANYVMGICGMGLSVFDANQEGSQAFCFDQTNTVGVKEVIGPDDLYRPTFDYMGSRVLVISRDRTAFWRYLF